MNVANELKKSLSDEDITIALAGHVHSKKMPTEVFAKWMNHGVVDSEDLVKAEIVSPEALVPAESDEDRLRRKLKKSQKKLKKSMKKLKKSQKKFKELKKSMKPEAEVTANAQ